jgi:hypothetical protein
LSIFRTFQEVIEWAVGVAAVAAGRWGGRSGDCALASVIARADGDV